MRITAGAPVARLAVAIVGSAIVSSATVLGLAAPAAAAPPLARPQLTDAQRAAAIVAPAMLFVESTVTGWVRLGSGELADDESITITTSCTGFAVSNDGYLLTASQCVDPEHEFFTALAQRWVDQGRIDADHEAATVTELTASATIVDQATAKSAPVVPTVSVQRGQAQPGAQPSDGGDVWPATIVEAGEGVALLKCAKGNQPMLAVGGVPKAGQRVLTTQYPLLTGTGSGDTGSVSPTARVGSIATTDPSLTAHAGPTAGLPGAPVTDLNGTVVGLVTDSDGPTAARDILASTDAMHALLEAHQVDNDLTPLDTDYRDGIDALLAGRYTDAVESFDAVLAIVPSHVQAHEYREQAEALRAAEGGGPRSHTTLLTAGVVAAAAVLVVSGVLAVVLRRRRDKPAL